MDEVLTASAGQEDDVDAGRVARGEPVAFKDGVPVYASGRAPAFLRTKSKLVRVRRKPAVGQRPVAYIYTRWYRDRVALWDPEQSAKMRPLSALQRRQMQQRRTCTDCREVFPVPVWGMCGVCRDREARGRADLRRRTCRDCGTVLTPAPARSYGDGMCLACDERLERGRRVALSLVERSCRRCLVQLFPLTVWAAMSEREQAMADWHCSPCEQEIEQEHVEAQQRADRAGGTTSGPPSRGLRRSSPTRTPTRSWTPRRRAWPRRHGSWRSPSPRRPGRCCSTRCPTPAASRSRRRPRRFTASPTMVEGAPTFSEILPRLTEALAGRRIVIYNREYDTGRLLWEVHLHHLAQGTVDFTKHPRRSSASRNGAATRWSGGRSSRQLSAN